MSTIISVRCNHCQLSALLIPGRSQLWLTAYGTGYCLQCQRFHHVPWPEAEQPPLCDVHHKQRLMAWQLHDPCPRCGDDLCVVTDGLRIDLLASLR